jgi:hypothetical protein
MSFLGPSLSWGHFSEELWFIKVTFNTWNPDWKEGTRYGLTSVENNEVSHVLNKAIL